MQPVVVRKPETLMSFLRSARRLEPQVARQARLVRLGVGYLSKFPDVALVVVIDVGLPRTVTTLAAMSRLRRAWILRLRVRGAFERITL